MNNILTFELRRAFLGKVFWLCFCVGFALAIANIMLTAAPHALLPLFAHLRAGDGTVPAFSFFGEWMGLSGDIASTIFYYLAPILATVPFGTSLASDLNSCYAVQVISRVGRKKYFAAKLLANFLAAGVVVTVPQIINIAIVACLVPQIPPDPTTGTFMVQSAHMLGDVFYEQPWLFIVIFLILSFVGSGLFSVLASALAFATHNILVVALTPFAVCMAIDLVTQGSPVSGFSPLDVIFPSWVGPSIFWVDVLGILLVLAGLIVFLMWKGSRYEGVQ